ncbi:MAG: hypothetical protein SFV15_26935 [Polyangiaceae bacterium]|nr:hypothetical protein [Polyangiaceae bacterium]
MCLDRVQGGYCTHTCQDDSECCSAAGECSTTHTEVCSPFESTGMNMCFLSCEKTDLDAAKVTDDQEYCQRFAGSSFICRSSGGGANNRKVCVPGDCSVGAGCAKDTDCTGGLTCITTVSGGYCGKKDCTVNADCGKDAACVTAADGKNYCYKSCQSPADCSFCRATGTTTTCTQTVKFAEAGTAGSVCAPTL